MNVKYFFGFQCKVLKFKSLNWISEAGWILVFNFARQQALLMPLHCNGI